MENPSYRFFGTAGLLVLFWIGFVVGPSGAAKAPGRGATQGAPGTAVDPAADLFRSDQVPLLEIEIPEAGLDRLREYSFGGRGGDTSRRPDTQATVREGTNVYRKVAIHLKGSAGSFRSIDDHPALTLNFDKFTKHQTFHGLERLSLNNSVQDPSFLSEQICRELFASAGVPVPRATHAQVKLNGRKLGLYVLLEAYNKQFLRRAFNNDQGNLYDGGFVREIDDGLEKSSGANPEDRSDLERLVSAATETNPTTRLARLEQVLDVDRFLTYLAIDVMICNGDGYAMNRNNYRIYHDPVSDRLVFMPHGLDQMFGTFRSDTSLPLFPPMNGLVARAVLQTPGGHQRFRERLSQLYTNVFRTEVITHRLQQLSAKIGPLVEAQSSRRAAYFDREVEQLGQRIVERGQSLQEQLSAPSRAPTFDSAGVARLTGWKARLEYGHPVADELSPAGDPPVLHLRADQGNCVGVWSAKVFLEPGHYRFEGRVRCHGITAEPGDRRGGACLRTHNRRATQKLLGDLEWADVDFEFEIEDSTAELELRCELRAAKGDVWFDRDSLRLKRK